MQVTETLAQGLKREFQVVLPAGDLASRLESQLVDLNQKVRINGFRPGKVPMAHLRRLYGKSVMSDLVQEAVNEANRKIVEDHGLRLALQPQIKFPEDKDEIERVLEARGDLAFTVNLEILPKFESGTFGDIELTRKVTPISDADVEAAIQKLADNNRPFTPKDDETAEAAKGDKLTIDFVGSIDGTMFEGGTGTGIDVIIGSDSFIPGFEEQLIGAKKGEKRTVKVRFPENYTASHLAGKDAEFEVTVNIVASPGDVTIDDEFAKGYGFEEGLSALREAMRTNMERDHNTASRDKLKRALLDALDKRYAFELPEGLVEQEFAGIWQQVEAEQKRTGKSFADENTTEEAARAEYRKIAERRVRLGLVLADVGEQAKVQVTDEEVTRALVERTRQFPGQEKQVWDYYRKNPEALAQLRAPLFEEKVVDHIIAQAKVTDLPVSRDELFRIEDEDAPAAAAAV